jgi:hypothetical protein
MGEGFLKPKHKIWGAEIVGRVFITNGSYKYVIPI